MDPGDTEEAPIDTTNSLEKPDNSVPNDDDDNVNEVQILSSTLPKTHSNAGTKSQPAP